MANEIDQTQLAESVSENIHFDFRNMFLVKPLELDKIKKEVTKPIASGKTVDEDGVEATDFEETETVVEEVESNFRKGIILKVPHDYTQSMEDEDLKAMKFKVGDTVVYRATAGIYFDLVKDSQLISSFDILGKVTK